MSDSIKKYYNYVDGKFCSNNLSEEVKIFDKYQKSVIGICYNYKESNFDDVTDSSFKSFDEMKNLSAQKRSEILLKLHQKLSDKREEFSQIISKEAGKPISYARIEVSRCLSTIKLGASEALRFCGEVIPFDIGSGVGKQAYFQYFPKGPIFGIAPFNFPLNLALHKIIPAIASGCPVVIKPSPYTPLSLLEFAKLVDETELPRGALNIIMCSNQFAEKLLKSDIFKTFTFTGSPRVGWKLKELAGKKNVLLELGGDAAVVIDDEIDLLKAAKECVIGSFLYSGQICISTQRIFIKNNIYDEFKKIFLNEIKFLSIGDPQKNETQMGPLIDKIHLERIAEWVNEAREKGGTILSGGSVLDKDCNLYLPTVLENVSSECKVMSEEIFGPVVILKKYENFEWACQQVNKSRFGLQAGIYTNRIDHMKKAFSLLDVGAVLMNSNPGFRLDHMPYGGVKDSGLGREGIKYVLEEYCEKKLLVY